MRVDQKSKEGHLVEGGWGPINGLGSPPWAVSIALLIPGRRDEGSPFWNRAILARGLTSHHLSPSSTGNAP